jgi:hypothetical protein
LPHSKRDASMSDDQMPTDSKLTTSKRRWAAEGKF